MGLIQSLIVKNETKKAIDVTARLAKLNRTFLTNSTKDLITLEEELIFLKEYTLMEHLRFEDDNDFIFNIQVSPLIHLNTWIIPPLILQPLVENAIKHGILPSKKRGNILIEIEKISNISIGIMISNPIAKAKSKVQSTGMGNNLVADRIEIFNNLFGHLTTARFEHHINEDGYYIARITLVKHVDYSPPLT
jgi:LytS/YehU family sensor histidine kinase